MMTAAQSMSAGDWIALFGVLSTLLVAVGGAIIWQLININSTLSRISEALTHHEERLDGHEARIGRFEKHYMRGANA